MCTFCSRYACEHPCLHRSRHAGFFLWIDLSKCLQSGGWQAEKHLKQELFDVGIEMSTGEAYHDELPGRFRLIFSVNKDMLQEGLRR
jgi:bifunctional pyridoxal-dependent enzyme with beta-cystathionase and maltose regulon repressor activities